MASDYAQGHKITRRIAQGLHSRLEILKPPHLVQRIINLGAATGADNLQLAQRFTDAQIISLDFSLAMLATSTWPLKIAAKAQATPLASNSVDLLWSHLLFPFTDDVEIFRECYRILSPGAPIIFSTLGPDSFKELRKAGVPTINFQDLHNVGDALSANGFSGIVMEMEGLVLVFADVPALFHAIRTHIPRLTRAGFTTPRHWQKILQAPVWENGAQLTLEVLYGHAWKPELTQPVHFHRRSQD